MAPDSLALAGLRVAHLIESDGPGGAERVVAQVAGALQEAGAWNVVFLPAGGEGWLARELEGSGVAIDYFRMDRPVSPACARSLERALLRHHVGIAHCHEFTMAVYGAWASRRCRIPHVITMHGSAYYAVRLRRRLALHAAIALSSGTAAVSSALAEHLSRTLHLRRSSIATIPNGVRYLPPERLTLRDELGLTARDRLLVSVGNLYPVKGHEYLIDALWFLSGLHPTLHLAIGGRGDLADALASRARDRGVAGRVHLLGLRPDIPAVLAAADVFVLPSLSEGLPLALLEAMFAARPIVATRVGEVPVALAHGNAGVLVDPGCAAALATGIDHLLRNPNLAGALGERAARRAAAEYDLSRMVQRYVDLYAHTMRGRSRAAPGYRPPWSTVEEGGR